MPRAKLSQSVSTAPTELHSDQIVEERPTLEARLSGLNRAQLQALVQTLAAREPNLVELIDEQLQVSGVAAPPSPSAKRSTTRARRATAAAVTAIRRQMRSLLRSCDYLGEAAYGVLELAEQARPHLDAGDGNNALTNLEAVTDEYVTAWTDLDDSDGDAEGSVDDLSALWAEAILTADLTPAERQRSELSPSTSPSSARLWASTPTRRKNSPPSQGTAGKGRRLGGEIIASALMPQRDAIGEYSSSRPGQPT